MGQHLLSVCVPWRQPHQLLRQADAGTVTEPRAVGNLVINWVQNGIAIRVVFKSSQSGQLSGGPCPFGVAKVFDSQSFSDKIHINLGLPAEPGDQCPVARATSTGI